MCIQRGDYIEFFHPDNVHFNLFTGVKLSDIYLQHFGRKITSVRFKNPRSLQVLTSFFADVSEVYVGWSWFEAHFRRLFRGSEDCRRKLRQRTRDIVQMYVISYVSYQYSKKTSPASVCADGLNRRTSSSTRLKVCESHQSSGDAFDNIKQLLLFYISSSQRVRVHVCMLVLYCGHRRASLCWSVLVCFSGLDPSEHTFSTCVRHSHQAIFK